MAAPMHINLSVVICTHNPRTNQLVRVLEALRAQTLATDQWELLVVDNASQASVAERCDLSWHPNGRCVQEGEIGLAFARQRGIQESIGELIMFVDDDNVLRENYLEEAIRIGAEWKQLGVWGGSIVPEFEVEPPAHLRKFMRLLALRKVESPSWSNVPTCSEAEPWGAGMCFRANVGLAYVRQHRQSKICLTDRTGGDLLCGGDTELCYVACSMGLGMGLFPELILTHLIPRERIMEEYLLRLLEGTDTSHHLIAFKWRGIVPRSPFRSIELLRHVKNFVLRSSIERRIYLARVKARHRARSILAATSGSKA